MAGATKTEDRGGRGGAVAVIAALVLLYAGYKHLDDKWFATHRPWNLFLVVVQVAVVVAALVSFILVIMRMLESEKDKTIGKWALSLSPVGLGGLIALVWGWRATTREETPPAQRDRLRTLMKVWSVSLVVQLVVAGYLLANGGGLGFKQCPLSFHSAVVSRDAAGVNYHGVRVMNNSAKPLPFVKWRAYPTNSAMADGYKRYTKWEVIDVIPPGSYVDLPHVYDRGWVFEFDCGDAGKARYRIE
jgi:hypothetical protein